MPMVAHTHTEMWPSLIEAHSSTMTSTIAEEEEKYQHNDPEHHHHQEDESGWEMIASASSTSIHRSISSPNFSSSSIALLESSAEDDQSSDHSSFVELDTSIVVDHDADCDGFVLPTPPHSPAASKPITSQSRTPSFRDAILLNASERQREEEEKREEVERREAEERLKHTRRSRRLRRIVVDSGAGMGMRRCAKSTGDLRMTVKIEEAEGCDGGGGGGFGGYGIIEEEVLGETDASDYYNRKSTGRASRRNGSKLRPDEAKRKAYIVSKKNAQRQKQGQKKEEGKRNKR